MTKEERRKYNRAGNLRRKYNLTLADYDRILKEQKGMCAGCGRPPTEFKSALAVDHDHSTRHVRGLLCWGCNSLLPVRSDLARLLQNLVDYLNNPPAFKALGENRVANPIKRKRRKRK